MKRLIVVLSTTAALCIAPAGASIIYVSGDVSGTWSADTVIVTGEVRVPPNQTLAIMPGVEVYFQVYCKFIVDNNATLLAVGTPTDSIRFDALQDTAHWHGIRFLSASNSSILEYCTLKHGLALATEVFVDAYGGAIYCEISSPTISNNTIEDNSGSASYSQGGGIYCMGANPTISNNTISGNSAYYGGGIFCFYSSPTISSNTINDNSAKGGGGIFCAVSSPTISNNTISGNTATGIYSVYGGAIYLEDSSPSISNNTISGNSADHGGGGIYCNGSSPTISGNTINGNSAITAGGIYCYYSSPTISHNIIRENSAPSGGGGVYCYSDTGLFEFNEISENTSSSNGGGIYLTNSSPTINKNTIAGNTATQGGGIYSVSSSPTLNNCILWRNAPEQVYQSTGSNVQATYSDINFPPVWPGTGNINTDPLFWDVSLHDYHLQALSPCINNGDPNPIYNDPDGSRADMGCYPYDSTYVHFIEPLSPRGIPAGFKLYPPSPNPFNPSTVISYELRVPSRVSLKVYDTSGRLVTNIVNGFRQTGSHEVTFDGSALASGLYFYRLTAGSQMASGKMVLLK
jgi:parallel beta-helix repeat protein